ncbi:MAG: S8 family serine peptidase [Myxococcales bacterium]|nr:S8 family serine peptidase [Myxococcales bacterium]
MPTKRLISLISLVALTSVTTPSQSWARSAAIGSDLAGMMAAQAAGDTATQARLAANGEAVWDGDLLQLQVHMRPGVKPTALTDQDIAGQGGRAGARAIDVMNVWLPLAHVAQFVRAFKSRVAFVRLPWRPHMLEVKPPVISQGRAKIIEDPDALACVGNTGEGVKVAVIDGGFEKLDKSIESGEVKHIEGKYPLAGGTHGTMCVEVVADMAPGATIRAISANSYTVLQQFQAEMKMGNPNNIDIVSHSVIWLGMSFGRNEGLACKVTQITREQGVAWVNASGNSGSGQFHQGVWADNDNDKKHDFLPKDPLLKFKQRVSWADIKLTLDWDDYKDRKVNLDLYLFREDKDGFLQQVGSSKRVTGPFSPPVEQIVIKKAPKGIYAAVLVAANKVPAGMRFRLINLGHGASSFSIWHKNGNVYDPGSCDGVLTVGAIHHSRYHKGPQEGYSSYGPTVDGRQKPEVMAPTSVKTSVGNFGGTSCACPHAAGALALYKAATTVSAVDLIPTFIEDAEPMGAADPNDTFGHGRVIVRSGGIGWRCDGGATQVCTTPCGTTGVATCGKTCGWQDCEPPTESCNGIDDDCDGETDEVCAAPDAGAASDVALDAGQPDGDGDEPTAPPAKKPDSGCQSAAGGRSNSAPTALLLLMVGLVAAVRRSQLGRRS